MELLKESLGPREAASLLVDTMWALGPVVEKALPQKIWNGKDYHWANIYSHYFSPVPTTILINDPLRRGTITHQTDPPE